MRAPALARRRFLAALAAGASLPLVSTPLRGAAQPSDPDVAVIGAGAAGIAACRALDRAGLSFVLLEAKDRIGGRAFTDAHSYDIPFDLGCSWLHQSNRNPLTGFARGGGYTLLGHDAVDEAVFVGDRRADAREMAEYGASWETALDLLAELGTAGQDVAPGPLLSRESPWMRLAEAWLGPLSVGVDFDDFSARDWWSLEYTAPNLMIREGLGTLVAEIGAAVPVSLSTPVEKLDWRGTGVRVDTVSGSLMARAAIITVSTGVLAGERLRFDPPLPLEKLRAIEGLPMGLLAKIPLQFDGERFGLEANDWLSYLPESDRLAYFLTWPFDSDLAIGFVGGRFGWELSKAGADEAVAFGLDSLSTIFGSSVRRHFRRGGFTPWASDPDVLGGYAYQAPGAWGARAALAEPVGDRLFFAGEATAGGFAMTCGGAFRSGERAAAEVVRALGR